MIGIFLFNSLKCMSQKVDWSVGCKFTIRKRKTRLKIQTSLLTKAGRGGSCYYLVTCCCCCWWHITTFKETFCFSFLFFWEIVDADEYCFPSVNLLKIFPLERKKWEREKKRKRRKNRKETNKQIHFGNKKALKEDSISYQ